MSVVEPRPSGRWKRRIFNWVEFVLPFVASELASRGMRPPTTHELNGWIFRNETLLRAAPHVADEIDDLVTADFERSASLEAKAVAILQGVAILAAVLIGVEVVTWSELSQWQKVWFVVSDVYATIALYQAVHASRPKVVYVYTEQDIEEQASVTAQPHGVWRRLKALLTDDMRVHSAARRMAYVTANRAARNRLSNHVEGALGSTRNSLIAALLTLLPYLLAWVLARLP